MGAHGKWSKKVEDQEDRGRKKFVPREPREEGRSRFVVLEGAMGEEESRIKVQ